jgi:phosphoglycerate-specific signal transduction histidine kinase
LENSREIKREKGEKKKRQEKLRQNAVYAAIGRKRSAMGHEVNHCVSRVINFKLEIRIWQRFYTFLGILI